MVNWNQGTKACTVLVGENSDSKPASTEANKTSSSRPRQQSSSGGNNSDNVYTRKRRDTPNQHDPVLHQTSQASESTSELPIHGDDSSDPGPDAPGATSQPDKETTTPLHEDISKSVHAELSGHENEQVSHAPLTSVPKDVELLPYTAGSSNVDSVLFVNVSSSITNSFLDRQKFTTTVNPLLPTSSQSSSSTINVKPTEPNEDVLARDTTNMYENRTTSYELSVDERIGESSNADRDQSTPELFDELELSEGPEISSEFSNKNRYSNNSETVDVPSVDYPASINVNDNDSSGIDFGKASEKNKNENVDFPVEDHVDNSTSSNSKHIDSSNGSLLYDNDNTASVNVPSINSDSKTSGEVLPVALPLVVNRIDGESGLNLGYKLGNQGDTQSDFQAGRQETDTTVQNDGIISSANISNLDESEEPKSTGVIKETQELSVEESSSELFDGQILSRVNASSEKSEELQRDYPVFSYGQDEVEIIKLDREPAETPITSNIDHVPDEAKEKDNLQIVNAEGEQSEKNFGQTETMPDENGSHDIDEDNSVQLVNESSEKSNNSSNDTLHDKHESSEAINANSITSNTNISSEDPLIQQVHVVELPRGKESQRQSRRVLVNVTIATEDFVGESDTERASRPVYMLSVSVPTDGGTNNFPGINISPMQLPVQSETSSMVKSPNVIPDEITTRIPPPPQPPASPPPSWGGECECSCPCMDSDEKDNFSDVLTVSEEALLHDVANGNFNSSYDDYDLFNSSEDSLESNNNTDEIHGLEGIFDTEETTTESWLNSTDLIDTESTTYSTEATTEGYWCSGTTPLPPEPIILILEGEALFSILLFFHYRFS